MRLGQELLQQVVPIGREETVVPLLDKGLTGLPPGVYQVVLQLVNTDRFALNGQPNKEFLL